MTPFNDLPIQKKLTLIISGVNIFALLLVFTIYSIERVSFLKKDLENMAHSQAKLIGEYCISPIVFDDKDGLKEIIEKSQSMDFINSVSVYDRTGKLIIHHNNINNKRKKGNRVYDLMKLNQNMNIVENINHNEILLGYINLEVNTTRLKKDLLGQLLFFLVIIILLYFVVHFLAKITQKKISDPILSLSDAAQKITDNKDYSVRITKAGNDEIGTLYDSFNSMIEQIDEHINEKNSMLDQIQVQYKRFLSILDSFPQHIYIVDPANYEILFVNQSLEKAFTTELVGRKCYQVLQGHSAPCDFCSFKHLQAENQVYEFNHYNPILRKQYHLTDKLIRWPNGKLVKLEFAQDITQQEQAKKKIENNEKRFYQIISQNPDAILILDKSKLIVFANNAAEKLFLRSSSDLIGNSLDFQVSVNEVSQNTIMRQNNEDAIVEIRTTAIEYEDRPAYQVILRDITARVKEEAKRNSLEKQLQQSQKMESFGALAGGIAHDFNNILTVINGYCEMSMALAADNTQLYDNLAEISIAGTKASSLTRQLLAFSRKQVMDPKLINIGKLAEDLNKMLKRLIGEDYRLEIEIQEDTCLIKADPGQIEQVLMNLVINARDASTIAGSVIKVSGKNKFLTQPDLHGGKSAEPGLYVVLSVEDTGIGMSPEIIDRIFEPFFTTKKAGSGTGLGLSVVFGIVKQHDGWINVYSEPEKGTVFNVYIPAVVETEIEKDSIREDISIYRGNNEKVLIIEDEDNVRKVAISILTNYGYSVLETATARDAEMIFHNNKDSIDLILSDVVLPDDSGVELVKRIRDIKPDIKILLNSGYTASKINIEEINKHGFRFIQKPYQVIELLKIVRELLDED